MESLHEGDEPKGRGSDILIEGEVGDLLKRRGWAGKIEEMKKKYFKYVYDSKQTNIRSNGPLDSKV